MVTPASLNVLRQTIARYQRAIKRKPYALQVIGLVLSQIAKVYSHAAAEQAIQDFKLQKLGWVGTWLQIMKIRGVEIDVAGRDEP